ncbi:MAG: 4-(cytidine 5'-diphospho)-2-C-methyl-D-erythritol kinase [Firmicutes bacterium]|nr:4-(cytidine 5'-diphospho)-2-C-methyl-D-erythritol kinase [Bacillota bacterium]
MQITAHAKLNWTLSVLGRREDGYHELDTLMQSVALGDSIEMEHGDGLTLALAGKAAVPQDRSNLALRAADVLRKAMGVTAGARILLRKRIPVSAGLGGGSADAAAVLTGLSALWGLSVSDHDLKALALVIGADVPFCLTGGLARARGVGEALTRLDTPAPLEVVIVKPTAGLSTPAVFAAYDKLEKKPSNPDSDAATRALTAGNKRMLAAAMGNALQAAAVPLAPEIALCAQALEHLGALRAQMTGSGSAVIGLFASAKEAAAAANACRRLWKHTFHTRTVDRGVSIIA